MQRPMNIIDKPQDTGGLRTSLTRFERLFMSTEMKGTAATVEGDDARIHWGPKAAFDRDCVYEIVASRMWRTFTDGLALLSVVAAAFFLFQLSFFWVVLNVVVAAMMFFMARQSEKRARVWEGLLGWYNTTYLRGIQTGLPVFIGNHGDVGAVLKGPTRWHMGGEGHCFLTLDMAITNHHTVYFVTKTQEKEGTTHVYVDYVGLATSDGRVRVYRAEP